MVVAEDVQHAVNDETGNLFADRNARALRVRRGALGRDVNVADDRIRRRGLRRGGEGRGGDDLPARFRHRAFYNEEQGKSEKFHSEGGIAEYVVYLNQNQNEHPEHEAIYDRRRQPGGTDRPVLEPEALGWPASPEGR